MTLIPSEIFKNLQNKSIDKQTAVHQLSLLIESSDDEEIRIESLQYLIEFEAKNDKFFKFLENLLISDSNKSIRLLAIECITKYYLEKAFSPLSWSLKFEKDYECSIAIIMGLMKINNNGATKAFIEEIKKIKKKKFIGYENYYSNKSFKKSLKKLDNTLKNLTNQELADILINHVTITAMVNRFHMVYFAWDKGLLVKLDFSDLGWNVNKWKQKYAEPIEDLSEIIGLKYLKHVQELDLSHNKLTCIKGLESLPLTHLRLSDNRLEDPQNLTFLEKMKTLKFLDISRNKIVKNIDKTKFKGIYLVLYHGIGLD